MPQVTTPKGSEIEAAKGVRITGFQAWPSGEQYPVFEGTEADLKNRLEGLGHKLKDVTVVQYSMGPDDVPAAAKGFWGVNKSLANVITGGQSALIETFFIMLVNFLEQGLERPAQKGSPFIGFFTDRAKELLAKLKLVNDTAKIATAEAEELTGQVEVMRGQINGTIDLPQEYADQNLDAATVKAVLKINFGILEKKLAAAKKRAKKAIKDKEEAKKAAG